MTHHARLAAAGLILAALGASACSADGEPRTSRTESVQAAQLQAAPFRIGALEAVALRAGALNLPTEDRSTSPWDPEAAGALLRAAGLEDRTIPLSIQPLLVRDGDRLVLIDAGPAGEAGGGSGLISSLRAAGVAPEQITDVLISHAHGDHVGGLAEPDGSLVFPNAVIRMSAPEWAAARAGAQAGSALIAAIAPKVEPFQPGAKLTGSITAAPLEGHTAGHTGFEIRSGEERLLYIGDALHSSIISVQAPHLVNAWDADSEAAIRTRRSLLERSAREGTRIYGGHLPFPGLGRFVARGDSFVWSAETPPQS